MAKLTRTPRTPTVKLPRNTGFLDITDNSWTAKQVSDALTELVLGGATNGTAKITGNECPNSVGMASATILIARGWTILCDFAIITQQPTFSVNVDGTYKLQIVANGLGQSLTYQWQVRQFEGEHQEGPGMEWVNVGGATSATFDNPPVSGTTTFEAGQETFYRCVVDRLDSLTYSEGAASLAPYADEPIPSVEVFNAAGAIEIIVGTAQADGGSYQWYKDDVLIGGASGTIAGGNVPFTKANAVEADAGNYKAVITAANGAKVTSGNSVWSFE
jgi:hypothetical protein